MTDANAPGACERPRSHPAVSFTKVDDDLVVYSPLTNRYLVLNHTGAQIWAWLDGTRSLDDVAGLLAAHYGLDRTVARQETQEFLALLATKGLLDQPPPSDQAAR